MSVSLREVGGRKGLLHQRLPGGFGLGTSFLTLSLLVPLVCCSSGAARTEVLNILVGIDLLFETNVLAYTNLAVDVNLETLIRNSQQPRGRIEVALTHFRQVSHWIHSRPSSPSFASRW